MPLRFLAFSQIVWLASFVKRFQTAIIAAAVILLAGIEFHPQSVTLIDWKLKPDFTDAAFKFTPPKGGTKIEIVPRKAS